MNKIHNQAKKALTSVTLFLCFFYLDSAQPVVNKSYQLNLRMTYGGEELSYGKGKIFVLDSLVFEEISTFVDRSVSTLQRDNLFATERTAKDSLTKYIVTNLKTKKCFVFSLSNPPKLLQIAPLSSKEKISGIIFKDEAYSELGNSAKNFKYTADTVIAGFKYHILENTVGFTIQNIPYRRARAFSNTGLHQFPFHPISKQIDNQFGGIITRIELYGNDGKAFITDYAIKPISKEKVAFINRYLKLLPGE